ncbi:hypothetical protein SmJEL517_g02672 [Synchytrium microbalum]|uniref:Serine/threonine-protein phosphatase n=1 Tax=Synchytrium microbalum TaxID=1806994 RepID=A0A507C9Q2_9FUNG|nr:uncharacterized protein SmJEL517_g02672 [Synchytrium microbalum]TPX34704.1 hypothetical protein SmJEL517_g02672 [Synchytrium microbalum]
MGSNTSKDGAKAGSRRPSASNIHSSNSNNSSSTNSSSNGLAQRSQQQPIPAGAQPSASSSSNAADIHSNGSTLLSTSAASSLKSMSPTASAGPLPIQTTSSSSLQPTTAANMEALSPNSQYLSGRLPPQSEKELDDIISRLIDSRNQKLKPNFLTLIKQNEILFICHKAREIFLDQPVLLELNPPVNIVGDTHGQYEDLLRIFDMTGYPPASNYLFLGDYVDRGKQSLETIMLLLCYKIKYPENFFILRGNHECASVNRVYGFYDECKRRATMKIWKVFTDAFNCMPLAAVVAGKVTWDISQIMHSIVANTYIFMQIFCVHGGLSPSLNTMDDIRNVSRPLDVPDFGLVNDLLWSDPSEIAAEWEDNERGVSYCFGKAIVTEFLAKHDFDLVCRAHMVVEEGYEFFNDRTLVTIFSAPNYCGEFDNKGGVMAVNDDLLCAFEILQPLNLSKATIKSKRRSSPPLGPIKTVN